MKSLSLIAVLSFLFILQTACQTSVPAETVTPTPTPLISPTPPIIAERFAYPVGKTETVTQAKDQKDEWFNAQDFGENDHLGEDWNKNSGGDTDCGESVYAIAAGTIVYAENAGPGWGNVLLIEHYLPDGTRVQSLYGHLQKMLKTSGDVKMREQIGEIGNADGRYLCHLHLELRTQTCPFWNQAGPGYSSDRAGWLDPSDFIDKQRQSNLR